MTVDFGVLGTTVVRTSSGDLVEPSKQQVRTMAALLLLDCQNVVPLYQIMDALWPEEEDKKPPATANNVVHQTIKALRKLLGEPANSSVLLVHRGGGYVLDTDPLRVDLHRFRATVAQARTTADAHVRSALLRDALALWRDDPLTGVLPGLRGDAIRSVLLEERRLALHLRIQADLELGRHRELVGEVVDLAGRHPHDEQLHEDLMIALYRSGRQADALTAFQAYERVLDAEGLVPGAAITALRDRIHARDPALDLPQDDVAPAVHVLPPQHVPVPAHPFTGRRAALAELDTSTTKTGPAIHLISGVGGIGKSRLAQHWAEQNRDRFPDGQLFVDLRGSADGNPLTTGDALTVFFDAFGLKPGHLSDDQARVNHWRSLTRDKTLLVVIDNATSTEQVRPLLPTGPDCTVLVLSRHHLSGLVTTDGAHHLHLTPMSAPEARAMLAARLGADRMSAESTAVDELLRACAGHPLALAILAGRALYNTRVPLADLVDELRITGLHIFDTDDPTASLSSVLDSSVSALDHELRDAFVLLGLVPGDDLDTATAAALYAQPPARARALLTKLVQVSLLEQVGRDRYQVHDLIRKYAAERTHRSLTAEQRKTVRTRISTHLIHAAIAADRLLAPTRPPVNLEPLTDVDLFDDETSALRWLTQEHRNLLAAQRAAMHDGEHTAVWQFAWALHTFHARRGYRQDHLATWQLGQKAAEALGDPAVVATVSRLHSGALTRVGETAAALELLGRALTMSTSAGDRDGQILTHQFLAWHWQERAEYDKALYHAWQMVKLLATTTSTPSVRLAEAHNTIGWCSARLGDFDRGYRHCTRALRLARTHHDTVLEAACLDSLGYLTLQANRPEDAITYLSAAAELLLRHHNTTAAADTFDRLATAYHRAGRTDLAATSWTKARTLYRRHRRTADATRVQQALDHLQSTRP